MRRDGDRPGQGWSATPLTERLGTRYPIVQGPFGGGRSTVELAAAVTNAGGLGSFGAVDLEPDGIAEVAAGIRRLTPGPFALNLWVPLAPALEPPPSSAQYAGAVALLRPHYDELGVKPPPFDEVVAGLAGKFGRQVEAVLAARPAVFSFIYGVPPDDVLSECRRLSIVTFGTATNVAEAEALAAAGIDVIVASGLEAGGHRSSFLVPSPSRSPSARSFLRSPTGCAGRWLRPGGLPTGAGPSPPSCSARMGSRSARHFSRRRNPVRRRLIRRRWWHRRSAAPC